MNRFTARILFVTVPVAFVSIIGEIMLPGAGIAAGVLVGLAGIEATRRRR